MSSLRGIPRKNTNNKSRRLKLRLREAFLEVGQTGRITGESSPRVYHTRSLPPRLARRTGLKGSQLRQPFPELFGMEIQSLAYTFANQNFGDGEVLGVVFLCPSFEHQTWGFSSEVPGGRLRLARESISCQRRTVTRVESTNTS